jgi:hypothetical protein
MQTHPDDQHIFLFEKKSTPGSTILPQGKVLPPTSIPVLIENLRSLWQETFNFFISNLTTIYGIIVHSDPN